jgi:hypothetical protein
LWRKKTKTRFLWPLDSRVLALMMSSIENSRFRWFSMVASSLFYSMRIRDDSSSSATIFPPTTCSTVEDYVQWCVYIYWICRNNKNLGLLSDLAILEKKYQATINNILFFQILIPLYIELIWIHLNSR